VYQILRNTHCLPLYTVKTVLFITIISYTILFSVMVEHIHKSLQNILLLQKRAVRIITKSHYA